MLLLWTVKVYVKTLCLIYDVALCHQKYNVPVNWTPFPPQIIAAYFSTAPNGRVGPGVESNASVLYGGSLYYGTLHQILFCSIPSKKEDIFD